MSIVSNSQTHVGCLVVSTVLGKSASSYQREVERLLSKNGPEWLNNRLKAIYNAATLLRNGDKEGAIRLYQENSISYHKGDGTPKGPFRPAVTGYVKAQRPSVLKRFAAVMRFYTCLTITGETITKRQVRKARPAIESVCTDTQRQSAIRLAERAVNFAPDALFHHSQRHRGEDFIPPKNSRYADGLIPTSYYYSPIKLTKDFKDYVLGKGWESKPYASMALSLMTTAYVPSSLDDITPCKEMREQLRKLIPDWENKPIGRITCLQEQGCKARVVCMPSAWVQLSMQPLHHALQNLTEKYFPDQSCQKDQLKGVAGACRHLQSGGELYCTDLSSATDRFPRDFSLRVLELLGMSNYAEAMREICDKNFIAPWGGLTKYGTGQPMGVYTSFPLFHLSNLLVANLAEHDAQESLKDDNIRMARIFGKLYKPQDLDRFPNGHTYYVLGDDVIFSDQRVSNTYKAFMVDMGVPISWSKSFEGEVAEFAGFMLFKTNHGVASFRPYKIPSGSEISNPIDFLANLGSSLKKLRSPYWGRMFDMFKATCQDRLLDLSPMWPEEKYPANGNTFGGDTQTIMSLSHVLRMSLDGIPDIGSTDYKSTHINSQPLFSERSFFDYRGFDPIELRKQYQRSNRSDLPPSAKIRSRLRDDPLMREKMEASKAATRTLHRSEGSPDPASSISGINKGSDSRSQDDVVATPTKEVLPSPSGDGASAPTIHDVVKKPKRRLPSITIDSSEDQIDPVLGL